MALIADVFDVIIEDNDGDVIATTTLQQANIDVTVQETEVRGGKGNQLLGVLHSNRDIMINLTDAEFKYEWMAKQLGQDIVTGAGVAYAMPKFFTAAGVKQISNFLVTTGSSSASNLTITLAGVAVTVAVGAADTTTAVATLIRATTFAGWTTGGAGANVTFTSSTGGLKTTAFAAGTTGVAGTFSNLTAGTEPSITLDNAVGGDSAALKVYDELGVLISGADYQLSAQNDVITFTTGVVEGDKVEVRTYQYATAAGTQTIVFDNAVFATGVKIILETVEIDGDETVTHKIQYQFDKAIPTGAFSLNTQSQRTAASQQFNLKVIKPRTTTVVGRVLRVPI